MFACESMAQVFFFLINTFGRGQDSSAVRCDRTCCLHPYLKNLKKKAPFAKYILKNMKFLINSSMWLNMLVQPGLPKFSELKGCNTQCAEQSFAWINKIRRQFLKRRHVSARLSISSNCQCLHNPSRSFKHYSMYVLISLPAMSLVASFPGSCGGVLSQFHIHGRLYKFVSTTIRGLP